MRQLPPLESIHPDAFRAGPRWAQLGRNRRFGQESLRGKSLKKMVGRDGIEPPTPGFSGLDQDRRKCAEVLVRQSPTDPIIVVWSALE